MPTNKLCMFQELLKYVRKYYNLQRKTVLNLELPKICRLGSYTYCHLDEEKLASTELAHNQIIPLSDCKLMAVTLKKHSQRFNAIQIGNKTLSGNDLDIRQRTHNLMTLKKKVMDETEWFENINYPKPPHVSDIPSSKLIAFKTILMNGVDKKML